VLTDLKWGLKRGVLTGTGFGILAGAVLAVVPGRPARYTMALVVLSYPAGGAVAGLIVGLLRQRITSQRRAVLVGCAAGLAAIAVLMLIPFGLPSRWKFADFVAVGATGIFVGGGAGRQAWSERE
jgi:hypothetical protein